MKLGENQLFVQKEPFRGFHRFIAKVGEVISQKVKEVWNHEITGICIKVNIFRKIEKHTFLEERKKWWKLCDIDVEIPYLDKCGGRANSEITTWI